MTNLVEKYGWNSDASPQSCGYLAPAVLKQIKALGVSSVLDLGSGNGVLCDFLAKAGFSMVGVEYDQEGVNVAKERYPSIPFYCLGVQDEPETVVAEQGHFDAVVSTEVIEHLFSPHLLPKFAKKVIRPGGYLIVTTPYHGYLKNLALSIFDGWDKHHTVLWHGGHIKFWSRRTLTTLLQSNGFTVEEFQGVGRFPLLWKSMMLVARRVA